MPNNLIPWTAVVSSDGRWLYAACSRQVAPPGTFIVKIDLLADTMVWIKPRTGDDRLRMLDEEQLLAAFPDLYDAVTGEIRRRLAFDPSWGLGSGPLLDHEVAANALDSATGQRSVVIAVNPLSGESRGRFVPRIASGQFTIPPEVTRLHSDGRRVLVVGGTPSIGAWFVVGDLTTGDVLFTHQLSHEWCEIDVNQDGTLAAVAVYADWFFGEGSPGVYLFDLVNYRLIKHFHNDLRVWPGQVRFLEGRNRLVVHTDWGLNVGWVQIIDLDTYDITLIDWPFGQPSAGALAVGPRPTP
jgi:hypothetical protein